MKIKVDPFPDLKQAAIDYVNCAANADAIANMHRDAAHTQKRAWAASDISKLANEAVLRGVTASQLAVDILAKPDNLAQRELRRQAALLKIEAATTPAQLDAAKSGY